MWFPSSLELTEAQDVSRAAQISQQIYQKQMSITEDINESAGSHFRGLEYLKKHKQKKKNLQKVERARATLFVTFLSMIYPLCNLKQKLVYFADLTPSEVT